MGKKDRPKSERKKKPKKTPQQVHSEHKAERQEAKHQDKLIRRKSQRTGHPPPPKPE